MSLLGRLNYISRFIAQLTTTCEPIFKLLKKDAAVEWTYECQEAFDKIKGTAMKTQALADHLAENPVDEEYEPLKTYFPDEEFYCTSNMAEYEACILGLRMAVDMGVQEVLFLEFRHIPRINNEVADALATLASMLHHPDKVYVDPLHIQVRDQHAYCNMVEEELDGEPWFHDVKEYI
ncbi:uncharacterized protein [Nicotiana sylvestris]|uniref:uncharacterized protein n=1 Tax=Nicotiana sylvestris TaxID=4096 RepID=UPI00388C6E38